MHNKSNVSSGLLRKRCCTNHNLPPQQVVKKFKKFVVPIALLHKEKMSSTNNTKVFML